MDDVLTSLVDVATDLLAVDVAAVATWDAQGEHVVADPSTREAIAGLIGGEDVQQLRHTLRQGVVAVSDAQADPLIPAPSG